MTQLERELKETLKLQEEMFSKELKRTTHTYKKHLEQITNAYTKQMSEALEVIEQQNKTLSKYESISTHWQISIDKEQMDNIESLFKQQGGELESLQQQLNILERKL